MVQGHADPCYLYLLHKIVFVLDLDLFYTGVQFFSG